MTQWHDPVVEEVRRIREQQAAEVNYDLKAVFERARRRQKQSKRKTVSFASAATSDNRQERQDALHRPVAYGLRMPRRAARQRVSALRLDPPCVATIRDQAMQRDTLATARQMNP